MKILTVITDYIVTITYVVPNMLHREPAIPAVQMTLSAKVPNATTIRVLAELVSPAVKEDAYIVPGVQCVSTIRARYPRRSIRLVHQHLSPAIVHCPLVIQHLNPQAIQ